MSTQGVMVRNSEGQFVEGKSGNPMGRPKGSKNKITLLKMSSEQAWRERNADRLDLVLDMILGDALDGDKAARKMIFDAVISKANVQEDKSAGHKQTITVHKMNVSKGTDVNPTPEKANEEE
jgi:hypothetical protein